VLNSVDDEVHNLVGLGDVKFLAPNVAAGQTVNYTWTAPTDPTSFKIICAYHSQMQIDLKVAP
jgi:hypothetical protein